MTSKPSKVGKLIVEAFAVSQLMDSATTDQWITASHKAGSKIPASAVSCSIQRLGELDVLCRAMESELVPVGLGRRDYHYLLLLSELWVGSAYAISYAFSDRRIFRGDQKNSKRYRRIFGSSVYKLKNTKLHRIGN